MDDAFFFNITLRFIAQNRFNFRVVYFFLVVSVAWNKLIWFHMFVDLIVTSMVSSRDKLNYDTALFTKKIIILPNFRNRLCLHIPSSEKQTNTFSAPWMECGKDIIIPQNVFYKAFFPSRVLHLSDRICIRSFINESDLIASTLGKIYFWSEIINWPKFCRSTQFESISTSTIWLDYLSRETDLWV